MDSVPHFCALCFKSFAFIQTNSDVKKTPKIQGSNASFKRLCTVVT